MEILDKIIELIIKVGWMGILMASIFFVFKIVIFGWCLSTIKHLINRLFDWLSGKTIKISRHKTKLDIKGKIITTDSTPESLLIMINEMRGLNGYGSNYVHESDVEIAINLIKKYKEDKKEKK